MIRDPAVAGSFYPESRDACVGMLDACFEARVRTPSIGERIVGGVVPHAGWSCSGRVTAAVLSAIADQRTPATIVFFGAVHRSRGHQAAIFATGRWAFPTGSIEIDARLAERVLGHTNIVVEDPYAHEGEHSIEVQVPFVQRLFPNAKLLPIMVPPTQNATEVGEAVARTLKAYSYDAVVIASSDLTHYGRPYGFTPAGDSPEGLAWAKIVNDQRMIDRILSMEADAIVAEAAEHRNACGSGAIAAAVAAARSLGAREAVVLDHTTSREVLGRPNDLTAVGYAGIVFTAR